MASPARTLGKAAGLVAAYYPFRWLCRALPRERALGLGRRLGRLWLGRAYQRRAAEGIEHFWGDELSSAQRRRLLDAHLAEAGASFVELHLHDIQPPEAWSPGGWAEVEGIEGVRRLQRGGKGAIMAGLHFGPFRYIPSILAGHGVRNAYFVLREPTHAPAFGRRIGEAVLRIKVDTEARAVDRFPEGRILALHLGGRAAVRALREELQGGRAVLMLWDTVEGTRFIETRLAGRRIRIPTGLARVARSAGAAIVPQIVWREPGRIRMRIGEPIEVGEGEAGEDRATHRAVAWFDPWFRRFPEQWWVWHRLGAEADHADLLRIRTWSESVGRREGER